MICRRWLLACVLSGATAALFAQSIDISVKKSVDELVANVSSRIAVGVGKITISDTGATSALSSYLRDLIILYASQNKMYQVMSDAEVNAFEGATNFSQTRSMNRLGNSGSKTSAKIQAMISGKYRKVGENIEVYISLTATSDGRIISAPKFAIPVADLAKAGIDVFPANVNKETEFTERQEALKPFNGDSNSFKLLAWTGDADSVFYDGDLMSFQVLSEKDCYIKVYHVDVHGDRTLVFPRVNDDRGNRIYPTQDNFLRANTIMILPPNGAEFTMGEPYGQENILVVASTQPFELSQEEEKRVKLTRDISRGMNVVAVSGKEKPLVSTAQFTYTILAK